MILTPPRRPQAPPCTSLSAASGTVTIDMAAYMGCSCPEEWQQYLVQELTAAGLPIHDEPLGFFFGLKPSLDLAIDRALRAVGASQFKVIPDEKNHVIHFTWY